MKISEAGPPRIPARVRVQGRDTSTNLAGQYINYPYND